MAQISSDIVLNNSATVSVGEGVSLRTGQGVGISFSGLTLAVDGFYPAKLLGRSVEGLPSVEVNRPDYRVFVLGEGPADDPRGKILQIDDWRSSTDTDREKIRKGLRAASDMGARDVLIAYQDFDPYYGFAAALEIDHERPQALVDREYRERLLEDARNYMAGVADFVKERPQSSVRRIAIAAQTEDVADVLREAAQAVFRGPSGGTDDLSSLRQPKL